MKSLSKYLPPALLLLTATTAQAQIEMVLETPAPSETVASVLFIRGWATAPAGIDRVELLINGSNPLPGAATAFILPLGESRPDVAGLFPGFPGAENSGFNIGFFFTRNTFPIGNNLITVTAYDNAGNFRSITRSYLLDRFETSEPNNFIRDLSKLSLAAATTEIAGDAVLIRNAQIDGTAYDLTLRFNTTLQSFALAQIVPTGSTQPGNSTLTPGTWRGPGACFNVAADGTRLTQQGSQCSDGKALDIEVFLADGICNNVEVDTFADVPIVNNTFVVTDADGDQASGTFSSGQAASGTVTEIEDGGPCVGTWSATPVS